jgi:molybdopterin-guanine dinucleotide biosynthesis protein A
MRGRHKALAMLGGAPMLQHVIDRLAPQVSRLLLNAPQPHSEWQPFGLSLVPDITAGQRGPLAGLLAALDHMAGRQQENWLLLCPCDAPFLPSDLGATLLAAATGKQASVVRYDGVLQATFSLWHTDVLPLVRRAVIEHNLGGFKQVLPEIDHRVVDWVHTEPPPFFNVNTPADLRHAERLLGASD